MSMRICWSSRCSRLLLGLLGVCAIAAARADDTDPPDRVARLSDVEGAVSLEPAGVSDWSAAPLNRPLTSGDRLWADQNSRAELDLGAVAVRLWSTTGFSFLNLNDSTAQMQLTTGALIVQVRELPPGQNYEIDTPNLAVSLQQPGVYRIEVSDAGDGTVVIVEAGAAQAAGGGQNVAIGAQQMVSFNGTDTLSYQTASVGAPDDFDDWSTLREQQYEDASSRQYVADQVPGAEDLDSNGSWQNTPDYGYVWTPTVLAGWAPYRFGQWSWIAPWGWTWVDAAPWGYAPFHYGRWVQWNSAWAWVPGPRGMRPLYAPALVGWVGAPGASFGANVGWFPLAPREVYVPPYPVSLSYVRNVNITNTTNVTNTYITSVYRNDAGNIHYANRSPGAITAVPQSVFTSGQQVGAPAAHLGAAVLAGAALTAAAPALLPTRQSVLGPPSAHPVRRPPAALLNRAVVARTPPPHAPVPFSAQLSAIEANGGRPLAVAALARLQPATPAAVVRLLVPGGHAVALRPAVAATRPADSGANLAAREHALQSSPLPSAPRSAPPPVPSPPRPAAQAALPHYAPPVPQQEFSADDPTHAYARPSQVPVYRPPPLPVYHPPTAANPQTQTQNHPAGQAAPRSHPQPSEPRDSAAHSDRTSRDRAER
jgi:hypothetical protein